MTPEEAKYPDKNLLVYGYFVGTLIESDPPQFLDPCYLSDQRLVGMLFDFTTIKGDDIRYKTWYGEEQVDTLDKNGFDKTLDLGRFRLIGNLELALYEGFKFYSRSLTKIQEPDARFETFHDADTDTALRQQITKKYILPLFNVAYHNPQEAKRYHNQLSTLTMPDLDLGYLIKMSETIINNGSDEALDKSLLYVAAYISAKNEDYGNLTEIHEALDHFI